LSQIREATSGFPGRGSRRSVSEPASRNCVGPAPPGRRMTQPARPRSVRPGSRAVRRHSIARKCPRVRGPHPSPAPVPYIARLPGLISGRVLRDRRRRNGRTAAEAPDVSRKRFGLPERRPAWPPRFLERDSDASGAARRRPGGRSGSDRGAGQREGQPRTLGPCRVVARLGEGRLGFEGSDRVHDPTADSSRRRGPGSPMGLTCGVAASAAGVRGARAALETFERVGARPWADQAAAKLCGHRRDYAQAQRRHRR
jgi:hypothetical protein